MLSFFTGWLCVGSGGVGVGVRTITVPSLPIEAMIVSAGSGDNDTGAGTDATCGTWESLMELSFFSISCLLPCDSTEGTIGQYITGDMGNVSTSVL